MTLTNTSTAQLKKRRQEFDSVATFAAEHTGMPDGMGDALVQLTHELAARQQAYERHCSEGKLESVVDDWFLVLASKPVTEVVESLAVGWETGNRQDELLLNPKNLFFDEIILTFSGAVSKDDFAKRNIISANFNMNHPVELEWLQEQLNGLPLTVVLNSPELEVHTVSTAGGDANQRIDFGFCPNEFGRKLLRYAIVYTI